jgi:hypothetical protein
MQLSDLPVPVDRARRTDSTVLVTLARGEIYGRAPSSESITENNFAIRIERGGDLGEAKE